MGSQFTAAADLKSWPALVAALALVAAPVARAAQPSEPTAPATASDVTAKERVAKGLEYYQAGNFDNAIAEFKAAYAAAPSPTILFPWAQAERLRGNCREAIELYQRFIDADPPKKQVEAAEQNREECAQRLKSADEAASSLVPGQSGDAPAGPAQGPQAEPEGPTEPEPAPEPTPTRSKPDALGWGLVGGGAGLAVVGAILLGAGAGKESAAASAPNYGEFDADKRGARGLFVGGGVLTGVGLALAIGGAVRLALVKKRSGGATAWFDPRGGLGLGGRF